jgi:hypothetical protein
LRRQRKGWWKMKIKALILVVLLVLIAKAQAYEYKVNRYNETLVVFNHPVLGVNCTPASLGKVIGVEGIQNTTSNFFLRLVPNKKDGELFCSFKLSNKELIDVKFALGDFVQTPVVDITRFERDLIKTDELEAFVLFCRGNRHGYKDVMKQGGTTRTIEGNKNTYRLQELYMNSKGVYHYVFEVLTGSTDRFLKLNNFQSNTLKYSSLVHTEGKAYLVLSSNVLINFKRVLP